MDQIEGVLTQKSDTFLKPSTELVTNLASGRRLSGSSPGLFVPETEVIPLSNNKPRPNFFNEQDFFATCSQSFKGLLGDADVGRRKTHS